MHFSLSHVKAAVFFVFFLTWYLVPVDVYRVFYTDQNHAVVCTRFSTNVLEFELIFMVLS